MSIFEIHNETMNIWSHLIGATIFILLAWWILQNGPSLSYTLAGDEVEQVVEMHMINQIPLWPLITQLLSIAFCFASSSTFHIGIPYSQQMFQFLQKVDHNGIGILIFGTNNCFI